MHKTPIVAGLLLGCALSFGQSSTSFKLEEQVFNAGGNPVAGAVPAASGFTITLDALGDSVAPARISSASFTIDGGFAGSYPPPGEVTNLLFVNKVTLAWDPEASAGSYNLYRDLQSNLPGLDFGLCAQQGLGAASATDGDALAPGSGFFYLVTAENLIDEEGSRGSGSSGSERGNANACP